MFGGGKNIQVDKDLFERLKKTAELAGYSSVDEFVTHLIERELGKPDDNASDEEVKKRLEGLGYIS
jgi:predicted CopG family antitoxin